MYRYILKDFIDKYRYILNNTYLTLILIDISEHRNTEKSK